MLGTVIKVINIKDNLGHTIWTAFENDRVEGNGTSVVTQLWRRGVSKFKGYGYMTWQGFVDIDGAEPPPPPPPPVETGSFPRRFKLVNTDDGTSADYVKVDN